MGRCLPSLHGPWSGQLGAGLDFVDFFDIQGTPGVESIRPGVGWGVIRSNFGSSSLSWVKGGHFWPVRPLWGCGGLGGMPPVGSERLQVTFAALFPFTQCAGYGMFPGGVDYHGSVVAVGLGIWG